MMNRIILFFKNLLVEKSLKDISWVFLGNIIFKGLAIIPFTILTRVLGPEEYGKFSIAISIAALAGELTDLGTNATFVRFGSEYASQGNKERLRALLSVTLRWKFIWGSFVCGIGILISGWLASAIFHDQSLQPYITLAFLGGLSAILTTQEFVIFQSLQEFKKLGIFQIVNGFLNLGLVLLVWILFGLDSFSAFMAYFIAPYLLVLATFHLIPKALVNISTWDREIIKQSGHFFKWMFVASIGFLIFNQVNIIMLGMMSSQSEVGYYNAAFRIGILMQLLTGSFDNVITVRFSSNPSDQFTKTYLKQALMYAGLIILVLIGVGIFANFAVLFLAGDAYKKSVEILQTLLLWIGLTTLTIPFTRVLFALKKTKVIASSTLVGSLVLVGSNIFLIPRHEALGAGISLILSQFFLLIVHGFFSLKALYSHWNCSD